MRILLVLVTALFSLPAFSQTAPLRTLDTEYEAQIWRAVGRVDIGGGGGYCSGTLIAPDLVLTAAHCLFLPGATDPVPVGNIVFHAGLRDGTPVMSRKVKAAAAHAAFVPSDKMTVANVRNDVGLLRLAEPISSFEIPSFSLFQERISVGPVSVVSYGRGRSETQSRQKDCQLTNRVDDLLFFDCSVVPGTSGAPIFSHRNGRGEILSIVSGSARGAGQPLAVGMRLPERVAEVKRQLRIQTPGPVAKVRRLSVGTRGASGAKFVRPGGS